MLWNKPCSRQRHHGPGESEEDFPLPDAITVFLISAYFGLVATLICSRDVVLAAPLSCAAVIFVTVRLDVVRFRWLAAEISAQSPSGVLCPA